MSSVRLRGDGEDATVHLDEHDECPRVSEIDDLVREIRDAVHVLGPADGGEQDLFSLGVDGLEVVLERVEQVALGSGERSVQIRGDEILPGAVAQAPGERIGVALRARGIRE